MKVLRLLYISIVIVSIVSCDPDLDIDLGSGGSNCCQEKDSLTTCVQFIDSETSEPLEGVYFTINYSGCGSQNYSNHSDGSGNICWDHRACAKKGNWFAKIDDYQWKGCYKAISFNEEIHMEHATYLKFKIKNVSPSSSSDEVIISYKNLACHGREDISFKGSNVNKTLVVEASPLDIHPVIVTATGANEYYEQLYIDYVGWDTTLVEIEY